MSYNSSKKNKYRLADYVVIALTASMGIGIKAIIVPLTQIITSALFVPGGVLAGGFYMAFLVLGASITNKRFTATLIALTQAVLVTITGTLGSHGVASLLTYTLPGIAVDILFFLMRNNGMTAISCFFGGMAANLVGSFAVNIAIFRLSLIPLVLALATASLSGGIGGLIANGVAKSVRKLGILGNNFIEDKDIDDSNIEFEKEESLNEEFKQEESLNEEFKQEESRNEEFKQEENMEVNKENEKEQND